MEINAQCQAETRLGGPLQSESAQASAQHQPRRRRRPALSCRECRRRKIKCDQKNPCAHCARHNAQCTYQPFRDGSQPVAPVLPLVRSRTSTASPAPSGHSDLSGQNRLVGEASHDDHGPTVGGRDVTASHSSTSTVVQSLPTPALSSGRQGHDNETNGHDTQNLLRRILQKLEEPTRSRVTGEDGARPRLPDMHHADDAGVVRDWKVILNKMRDLGRGGWAESAQEFSAIIACWGEIMGTRCDNPSFRDAEVAALVTQAGDFLSKCKNTAKRIKLVRPTRGLASSPDFFLVPPPRETSDAFAGLYLQCFESTHRILHVPTFWADYKTFFDCPESATPALRLTILLVIAIGSSLHDYATPEDALRNVELVHHWIYAAETWLAGPLEKDRVDLTGLQIYCLTLLARQIFSIGGDTVWMSGGSLIHRAMQIGLHRDPKRLPGKPMSVLQAEVRRRLWATILELVVQASLDSRMPPRISLDEFDTQLPSNIDDAEVDDLTTLLVSHPEGRFTTTSVQLALLRSLPVRLRILKVLTRVGAEVSYQQILTLSLELIDALHANSRLMKESPASTPFHRNLLDYLVRRFVIPLHYFFSNRVRLNPAYYYSLKLSADAATAIMSPEPDAGFSRLMTSGGGLFREGLRVASMATGLELLVHVQTQQLDGTLQRAAEHRNLLKQAIRDMISLSVDRIRQGETNVKSHMFLNMILGQVEAIETDSPVELQISRRARDSLEYCYGELRARADRMQLAPTPESFAPVEAGAERAQGSDGYAMELDWETFFPEQAFFGGMTT